MLFENALEDIGSPLGIGCLLRGRRHGRDYCSHVSQKQRNGSSA
jgi:hypothetical protein